LGDGPYTAVEGMGKEGETGHKSYPMLMVIKCVQGKSICQSIDTTDFFINGHTKVSTQIFIG